MIEGLEIKDLRTPTVHSKECRVKMGRLLSQHWHAFDHISVLAVGTVELRTRKTKDEVWQSRFVTGPAHLIIEAGVFHEIRSVTDVVWYCIHSAGSVDANLNDFGG